VGVEPPHATRLDERFTVRTPAWQARARAACIESGDPACARDHPVVRNFTRWLAKNAEHTQGVQGEDWSPGIAGPHQKADADMAHWSNAQFAAVHNARRNKFDQGDLSWIEARAFNALALGALPADHPLGKDVRSRLAQLAPREPATAGLTPVPAAQSGRPISCAGSTIAFGSDGALSALSFGSEAGRQPWASPTATLFALTYTTYNKMEPWDARVNMTCSEPGCANPEDRVWRPRLTALWHNGSAVNSTGGACRVVAELAFDDEAHRKYGAPLRTLTEYTLGASGLGASVTWWNKSATRLPESLMMGFAPPRRAGYGWAMDVLGEWVRPDEVLGQGGTAQLQRGIWRGARYTSDNGTAAAGLSVDSLDAAMACPIVPSLGSRVLGNATPIGEGNPQVAALTPDLVGGMAFSLQHNLMPISGFAQWYPFGVGNYYQRQDEASLFRFELRV